MNEPHAGLAPSRWIVRWGACVRPGGAVLDVACGRGRHARWFAARGHAVDAVDADEAAVVALGGIAGITPRAADLEGGPWPYGGRRFAAVVVANYLHRPLFPRLLDALADDGLLIYETFTQGNERYGRPANPDHLLRHGELLDVVHGRLRVIAYEDLHVTEPKPAAVQRICAAAAGVAPAI